MKYAMSTFLVVYLASLGGCCNAFRNLLGGRGAACGGCAQAVAPNYLSAAPCQDACEVGSPVVSGMMDSGYEGGTMMGEYPGYAGEGYPMDGNSNRGYPVEGYPLNGTYAPNGPGNWIPTPQGSTIPQQVIPGPVNK